jgi:two-component system NarL family sensor kinase
MDNVERHATPSHAALRLRVDAGHVRLEIADDGPGIAAAGGAARARSGRGLADMRAEAAAIGASLSVASDRGTVIELTWPARQTPEEPATGGAGFTARPGAPPA